MQNCKNRKVLLINSFLETTTFHCEVKVITQKIMPLYIIGKSAKLTGFLMLKFLKETQNFNAA